jgi:hypothetical protein
MINTIIKDSTGKTPKKNLLEFYVRTKKTKTNKTMCIQIVLFQKITIFHHHYLIKIQ